MVRPVLKVIADDAKYSRQARALRLPTSCTAGESPLEPPEPLQQRADVERTERFHVQSLEPGALRGGHDQVQRREVAVGEDLLLDEPAVRAL